MKLFYYSCMGGCGTEQQHPGYRPFGVRMFCVTCRRDRRFVDPMPAPATPTPYALTDAETAAEAAAAQEAEETQDAALDAELARLPAVTWTEEDAAEAERRALARQERG